jgi:hypothetical protein
MTELYFSDTIDPCFKQLTSQLCKLFNILKHKIYRLLSGVSREHRISSIKIILLVCRYATCFDIIIFSETVEYTNYSILTFSPRNFGSVPAR